MWTDSGYIWTDFGHIWTDSGLICGQIPGKCGRFLLASINGARMRFFRLIPHPMETKSRALVVKSNRLIEASYRLTVVEQRIILMAISVARRTGAGLNAIDFINVKASDYADLFGIPAKQAYEQIKDAEKTLFAREFTLYRTCEETGEPEPTKGRWVSAASYMDARGTIKLQFSGIIIPYITQLEAEFTRYQLDHVARMTSTYAIRLYEVLVQWKNTGKREIEVQWLREIFMLEDQYPLLADLKKRVIDVAVAQINQHTNLSVSYSQRKTGRVVTHLIFEFGPKNKVDTVLPKLTKEFIESHAYPGETWEQAEKRLRAQQ